MKHFFVAKASIWSILKWADDHFDMGNQEMLRQTAENTVNFNLDTNWFTMEKNWITHIC